VSSVWLDKWPKKVILKHIEEKKRGGVCNVTSTNAETCACYFIVMGGKWLRRKWHALGFVWWVMMVVI